ncbi:type IX secretion system membrane protein PorP/SprF [Pseudoflavitalea sp. X16]|uniref:type IX secretion system membrane protein PorP/SprF n=1 Tax=Paraflavitalea devenefica TaxID=2716334 RepID=UPI00141E7931|nr:type IX secretion system membrane protein PorP/SprF [Paraflavitalea devenefica]NII29653.1 type IX secretion system membrane protein PorP/SprF [Paraflavitalea devenefica]
MKSIWFLLSGVLLAGIARAQEINFSRVQDMAVWYNQSLKTDKLNSVKLNYRNVQYGGVIAYNSISAMADMPLIAKSKKEAANTGYFSASAGAASDKSNQGILNNTLGLLGISYALPIGKNETYLAAGFQGVYYQSNLNVNGGALFGDQYDKYGPVEGMASNDRYASGWSYGYFNLNAGISVFNNSAFNKWYLGASVMHVNKPYTDKNKTKEYRLSQAWGVQGGYRFVTGLDDDECAFYASMNWQGKAYKHFFNGTWSTPVKQLPGTAVGLGLGYRYEDALVPSIELRYVKLIVGISYDMNISDISASGIKRNGLELALRLDF